MTDEYYERKIRVYEPKHVKEGGALQKYVVKPITKVMGKGDKESNSTTRRLTA